MISTALIGFTATLLTSKTKNRKIEGLTIDTIDSAISFYKGGGEPNFKSGEKAKRLTVTIDESVKETWIHIPKKALDLMSANEGDLLYMSDSRWWLGGLRSSHVKVKVPPDKDQWTVAMSKNTFDKACLLKDRTVTLEKII